MLTVFIPVAIRTVLSLNISAEIQGFPRQQTENQTDHRLYGVLRQVWKQIGTIVSQIPYPRANERIGIPRRQMLRTKKCLKISVSHVTI